jgi:hypothetical protein
MPFLKHFSGEYLTEKIKSVKIFNEGDIFMNKTKSIEEKGTELAIIDYMNRRERKTNMLLMFIYIGLFIIAFFAIETFVFKNAHIADKDLLLKISAIIGLIMVYFGICLNTEKKITKCIPALKDSINKWVAVNCANSKVSKLKNYYINQLMDNKFASSKDARQHLKEIIELELISQKDSEDVEKFISEYEMAIDKKSVAGAIKKLIMHPLSRGKLLNKYSLIELVNATAKK